MLKTEAWTGGPRSEVSGQRPAGIRQTTSGEGSLLFTNEKVEIRLGSTGKQCFQENSLYESRFYRADSQCTFHRRFEAVCEALGTPG